MIKKYLEFINEELNQKKLSQVKGDDVSNLFTSSIEIELEMLTDLKPKRADKDYSKKYIDKVLIDRLRNNILKELSRSNFYLPSKDNNNFLEECLDFVSYTMGDDDELDSWVEDKSNELNDEILTLKDELEGSDELNKIEIGKRIKSLQDKLFILDLVTNLCISYFYGGENFEQVEKKFQKKFPNFFKKWGDMFKFELDNTLKKGIELSNKTYFNSINELIECIHDFYNDYDLSPNVRDYELKKVKGQEIKDVKLDRHFSFKKSTGIHINLGFKDKNTELNLIKGLLFLDDFQKEKGHIPYVFKGIEKRVKSDYVGSLKPVLLNNTNMISDSLRLLKENRIDECESLLNSNIMKILTNQSPYDKYEFTYKNFGLNILPLEKYKYIEFRYIGHKVEEDVLEEKIYYFTYIMWSMSQIEMDREEYLKKLYKFLTTEDIPEVKEYVKK